MVLFNSGMRARRGIGLLTVLRYVTPEAAEAHGSGDVFVINRETIQYVHPVCFLTAIAASGDRFPGCCHIQRYLQRLRCN